MATLREELVNTILPNVLPKSPSEAILGSKLLEVVKPLIEGTFTDNSIRQAFSVLSADSDSPIAKVEQGYGYYFRPGRETDADVDIEEVPVAEDGSANPSLEIPRLCRGGTHRLTFPGFSNGNSLS